MARSKLGSGELTALEHGRIGMSLFPRGSAGLQARPMSTCRPCFTAQPFAQPVLSTMRNFCAFLLRSLWKQYAGQQCPKNCKRSPALHEVTEVLQEAGADKTEEEEDDNTAPQLVSRSPTEVVRLLSDGE